MVRWLVAIGLVLVVIGLLWPLLSKLGLSRLPGDILIERGNFRFYFPIVTCLIVSIVLSFFFCAEPLKRPGSPIDHLGFGAPGRNRLLRWLECGCRPGRPGTRRTHQSRLKEHGRYQCTNQRQRHQSAHAGCSRIIEP